MEGVSSRSYLVDNVDVQKSTNEQCGQCLDRRIFGCGSCCFNKNSEKFMQYVPKDYSCKNFNTYKHETEE